MWKKCIERLKREEFIFSIEDDFNKRVVTAPLWWIVLVDVLLLGLSLAILRL